MIEAIEIYMSVLDEMESFLIFIKNDNYSGSLDTTGAVVYEDDMIGMNMETDPDYTISYSHKDISQPLFHRPPRLEDVRQGGLGDCYLLAGLASIVATDPALITRSMKDLGDYVCVQFYKAPDEPKRIIKVTVKKSVPKCVKKYNDSNNEDEIISDPIAEKCLWVQMIEKAYTVSGLRTDGTKGKRVYQDIEGGYSHVFIQQMTGRNWKIRDMAEKGLLNKGNSLIGVYLNMKGKAGRNIGREHLIRAAIAIYNQLQSTQISIEDAVEIAVKMEAEEKKKHLKTGKGGKMKPGKAMVLTDLYRILQSTGLTVPPDHMIGEAFIAEAAVSLGINKQVFDNDFIGDIFDQKTIEAPQHEQMAADIKRKYGQEGRFISEDDSLRMAEECERRLDRLAESRGITLFEMEDDFVGSLFDQRTKSGTREQEALADRIRQIYAVRNMWIGGDDSLTLAIAYEEAYKQALAEAMIRKLKAKKDMTLAYSIFYSRIGKHGEKKRYTRTAIDIYEEIEKGINKGDIITAGTVPFHRNGDNDVRDGLQRSGYL